MILDNPVLVPTENIQEASNATDNPEKYVVFFDYLCSF